MYAGFGRLGPEELTVELSDGWAPRGNEVESDARDLLQQVAWFSAELSDVFNLESDRDQTSNTSKVI